MWLALTGLTFVGCHFQNAAESKRESSNVRHMPPPKEARDWEPILFDVIDGKIKQASLLPLRTKTMAEGDLEIRVWTGFGETAPKRTRALMMEKNAGGWSAIHLPPETDGKTMIERKTPRRSWDALWKELDELRFLALPDITETKGQVFEDAPLIVVEIKDGGRYRNYMQVEDKNPEDYPPQLRTSESVRLTEACRILSKEFNVALCF